MKSLVENRVKFSILLFFALTAVDLLKYLINENHQIQIPLNFGSALVVYLVLLAASSVSKQK